MLDVQKNFKEPFTEEKLFAWHKMLMMGNPYINSGRWRTNEDPMQVVSGAMGKERVHFEAPPSLEVPQRMSGFINWLNDTSPSGKKAIRHAPVRAAIAHLYFETIHPFEVGNGRIGRAISEKALSQGINRPILLSLSQTIEADKKSYYQALKKAQRSNKITGWLQYFISITIDAQQQAENQIDFVLKKAKFFDRYEGQLNLRQLKVIRKMLDYESKEFEGGMSARRYVNIAKVSKATATRDLQELTEIGAFISIGAGRSRCYQVNVG